MQAGDGLITVTCNSRWPEIRRELKAYMRSNAKPILRYWIQVIEFQCRESAWRQQLQDTAIVWPGVQVFYVLEEFEFDEILQFVRTTERKYGIPIRTLEGLSLKQAIEQFATESKVQLVVDGSRKDDPNAKELAQFTPSSADWPPFMRLAPIIEWEYAEVWEFLRYFELPYCFLYDQGYTSIGSTKNTEPNPALLNETDGRFGPAYLLPRAHMERWGRAKKNKAHAASATAENANAAGAGSGALEGEGAVEVTAAVLIIGNEILSGDVIDTNSTFLCKQLRACGISVAEICTVRDDSGRIGERAWELSTRYDLVFCSGGIGATHDDITIEAVAAAFGCGTVADEGLASLIAGYIIKEGDGVAERRAAMATARQMALVPEGSNVVWSEDETSRFPLVIKENVHIFPGVPELLEAKFETFRHRFEAMSKGGRFFVSKVYLRSDEMSVTPHIDEVVARFPSVEVGSYPGTPGQGGGDGYADYRTVVTFAARDTERAVVAEAAESFAGAVADAVVRIDTGAGNGEGGSN
eukprot:g2257.t1